MIFKKSLSRCYVWCLLTIFQEKNVVSENPALIAEVIRKGSKILETIRDRIKTELQNFRDYINERWQLFKECYNGAATVLQDIGRVTLCPFRAVRRCCENHTRAVKYSACIVLLLFLLGKLQSLLFYFVCYFYLHFWFVILVRRERNLTRRTHFQNLVYDLLHFLLDWKVLGKWLYVWYENMCAIRKVGVESYFWNKVRLNDLKILRENVKNQLHLKREKIFLT